MANRTDELTKRDQQKYIKDNGMRMLYFASRACPCNGVGCDKCSGDMRYFDEPIPVFAVYHDGLNRPIKKPGMPEIKKNQASIMIESDFAITKGDRWLPFGVPKFETAEEVIPVGVDQLTHVPIHLAGVVITFSGSFGVQSYKAGRDFKINKQKYGRVPLLSKEIEFVTDPPAGAKSFTARYGYYPFLETDENPEVKVLQGMPVIQSFKVNKVTANRRKKKAASNTKSSVTITGGLRQYGDK